MESGPDATEWIELRAAPLPVAEAVAWAVTPSCGGVVSFTGTVRDHAPGRSGVTLLEYEAYEEFAVARLRDVAAAARVRWPMLGRIALLHRTGALAVTEAAVLVVAATPSRAEAFAAAHFAIDAIKSTVPIWKLETWEGGSEWSEATSPVGEFGPGFVLDLHDHGDGRSHAAAHADDVTP